MIFIDDRRGSKELASHFPPGEKVDIVHMDFGDFSFLGNGMEGPVAIGLERKSILDLINSIVTGRLSGHQLIGLTSSYTHVYLIIEGIWRYNPVSGILETWTTRGYTPISLGQRRFMAKEIVGYLNTLSVIAGVHILQSSTQRETVQIIRSLYHWWNDKEWGEHKSHLTQNKSAKRDGGTVSLVKPSLLKRVAAELTGVGWGKAAEVDKKFGNVGTMVNAPFPEWMSIPGFGKTMVTRIINEMWEEKH